MTLTLAEIQTQVAQGVPMELEHWQYLAHHILSMEQILVMSNVDEGSMGNAWFPLLRELCALDAEAMASAVSAYTSTVHDLLVAPASSSSDDLVQEIALGLLLAHGVPLNDDSWAFNAHRSHIDNDQQLAWENTITLRRFQRLLDSGQPVPRMLKASRNDPTVLFAMAHRGIEWPKDFINRVIAQDVPTEITNSAGNTVLMLLAAEMGQRPGSLRMLKDLIDHRVSVTRANHRGLTAVHLAANSGNVDALRMLVEAGADINALDMSDLRSTALHHASTQAHPPAIAYLLSVQADVNITDHNGRTALDVIALDAPFSPAERSAIHALLEGQMLRDAMPKESNLAPPPARQRL